VGSRLLRTGDEDRGDHADLAVGGALGGRPVGPGPDSHTILLRVTTIRS
jgi:hypothetical protein